MEETKQQKRDARKRDRELSDIRWIISSPEGRRFYWRILSDAGVFRSSFSGDSNITMYNEGRRTIGLDLLGDLLSAKPSAFSQMQDEYASELKSEETLKKQEDSEPV